MDLNIKELIQRTVTKCNENLMSDISTQENKSQAQDSTISMVAQSLSEGQYGIKIRENAIEANDMASYNSEDLAYNINPYLMDMDYRVVCVHLKLEELGYEIPPLVMVMKSGAKTLLEKDIKSKRLAKDQYIKRILDYHKSKRLSNEDYDYLEGLLNE